MTARRAAPRRRQARVATFARSSLRTALVWTAAAKVAGLVLVMDPLGVQAFDLPKTAWSRATEWALIALLALALARYGRGIVPRSPVHLAVAALVLATCLSGLAAADAYVALYGEADRYLGIFFVLDMAVLFLAVAVAVRGRADWAVLAAGIAVGALGAIGYAGVQLLGADPVAWSLPTRTRPFGTFGHPDIFGQFLGALCAASVALALAARDRRLTLVAAFVAALALLSAGFVATRGSALGHASERAAARRRCGRRPGRGARARGLAAGRPTQPDRPRGRDHRPSPLHDDARARPR